MKRRIRLSESDLHRVIKESVRRILRERTLPSYENPVCIGCESKEDAEYSVEIGYSDYSSSLFYVGPSYDEYDALERVVKYLIKNGIIDNYTGDEDIAAEYPSDFIDVMGYPIGVDNFVIHRLN